MFKYYFYPVILNLFYSTWFVGEKGRSTSDNLTVQNDPGLLLDSSLELMVARLIQTLNGLSLRANRTRTYIKFESEFGPIEELFEACRGEEMDHMVATRFFLSEILRGARLTVSKRFWFNRFLDWIISNADLILGVAILVTLYLLFIFTFKKVITFFLRWCRVSNRKVVVLGFVSILLLIYQWPLFASIFIQARFMIIYLSLLLNAWLLLKLYYCPKCLSSSLLTYMSSITEPICITSNSNDQIESITTATLNNNNLDELDYCDESGYFEEQADDTMSVASQNSTFSTTSSSLFVRKLPICSQSFFPTSKLSNGLQQYNHSYLPSIEDELEHQD